MTIVLAPPRSTNGSLLESFAEDATLRGLTKETLRAYLSYGGILGEFLASRGKGFLDVDADLLKDVLRFVLDRGVKAKTVRAYFSALSAVCDYLQYDGLLPANPVPPFRKRYLRDYKKRRGEDDGVRRILSVEEARTLIGSVLDPRDRAMLYVLAKTGVRREELIAMDVDDVDFVRGAIRLKPHAKRSNGLVFIDDEAAHALKVWLRSREEYALAPGESALFVGQHGGRLRRQGVYEAVVCQAVACGLQATGEKDPGRRVTPHVFRHFFTTMLRRNGMPREFIKWLRGDARNEAIDRVPGQIRRAAGPQCAPPALAGLPADSDRADQCRPRPAARGGRHHPHRRLLRAAQGPGGVGR